jgi:hypothetical protein
MTELTARPEQTYALVVGIEKYKESDWDVKGGGPANNALQFAHWLRQRGMPKKNIKVCLSPLEENSDLVEQQLKQYDLEESKLAINQNLFEIITNDLSQQEGDLLYIYWAGHGVMNSQRKRHLICADATEQNWSNLDWESLLPYLRSDLFEIRHHILILEACANYIPERKGIPKKMGKRDFPEGKPIEESRTFILFAAREGETAKVSVERKTGYFSEALINKLNKERIGSIIRGRQLFRLPRPTKQIRSSLVPNYLS